MAPPKRIPPQRQAEGRGKAKRRQPKMSADEKASVTRAARELAEEINSQLEETKQKVIRHTPEERKARNARAAKRGRMRRRGDLELRKCHGLNMAGKPCGSAPLIKENWKGDEEVTGLYCVWHEPTLTDDQREAYMAFGDSKRPTYRKVTPGEIAHKLIQRHPQYFLAPYLKSLGLRLEENGELTKVGTGLKLYGYSRGGEVVRSRYPDLIGQTNIAEKLWDRVYGKPRQAVDLAASSTTVAVHIVMDENRVNSVSSVLAQAGALNGHQAVIESTARDAMEEEDLK